MLFVVKSLHFVNFFVDIAVLPYISLSKADVPEQLLKKIIGHSEKMDTFGVYGHKVDGEMDKVSTILDTVFDGVFK